MSNDQELPRNWDWVAARSECSERQFFERLYLGAVENVAKRTALLTSAELSARTLFRHESHQGLFSVFTEASNGPMVRFRLDGKRIVVESDQGDVKFDGTITLDDRGRCRLRVGNEELDEWQVLKRALEQLLFP